MYRSAIHYNTDYLSVHWYAHKLDGELASLSHETKVTKQEINKKELLLQLHSRVLHKYLL